MKHQLGTKTRKQPIHRGTVTDIGQERVDIQVRKAFQQLHLDGVQVELATLDQHQLLRLQAGDLAAHLRANGATGTADQHGLVMDAVAQLLPVQRHRVTPEQVFDGDLAQGLDAGAPGGDILDPRQGQERHPGLLAIFHHLLHLRGTRRRDGDDYQVHREALDHVCQTIERPTHRHAVDLAAL